ncbi:hypothetical protein B0H17DRAFT_1198691 [Mycena rosella]|uniref:Uncharacterized protein n=1 Tax=Mycena rosella TaxID=1033263 RepID=A0AAD7DMS0_MYCRO|nr:hypothetical protein B0H17DRAFT_1198691 [Mycena rosella]
MDSYLNDRLGNELIPIWSPRGVHWLCTLSSSPSDVPANILTYYDSPPNLLSSKALKVALRDLDFTTKASLYNPREHWLGWTPAAMLPSLDESLMDSTDDDPIDFLFDNKDVGMTPVMYRAFNKDSERPQSVPVRKVASYELAQKWVETI